MVTVDLKRNKCGHSVESVELYMLRTLYRAVTFLSVLGHFSAVFPVHISRYSGGSYHLLFFFINISGKAQNK